MGASAGDWIKKREWEVLSCMKMETVPSLRLAHHPKAIDPAQNTLEHSQIVARKRNTSMVRKHYNNLVIVLNRLTVSKVGVSLDALIFYLGISFERSEASQALHSTRNILLPALGSPAR